MMKLPEGKKMQNLAIMLLAGIMLLVAAAYFRGGASQTGEGFAAAYIPGIVQYDAAQTASSGLESQLENILSRIAGAGEVSVMLHWSESHELVFAQNITEQYSRTAETDSHEGQRTIDSQSRTASVVSLRQSDGSEIPLILREISPQVQGVIIVAQGGGDAAIAAALHRAASAALGVQPHQVQVFAGN